MSSMTANPRVFVWIALALILWLNWEAWMRDYAPATPPTPAASTQSGQPGAKPSGLDTVPQASAPSSTNTAADKTSTPTTTGSAPAQVEAANAVPTGGKVHVLTDVLDLDISLQGGTFERADLLKYPKVKGGDELVRLMNTSPDTLYLLQTGLTGPSDASRPTHFATFTSAQADYRLGNAQELRVPLTWTDGNGVTVTKTYIFKPGSYRIDLEYSVDNKSAAPWQAAPYAQIMRTDPVTKRSIITTNVENYAFHGPAIWDTKYRK